MGDSIRDKTNIYLSILKHFHLLFTPYYKVIFVSVLFLNDTRKEKKRRVHVLFRTVRSVLFGIFKTAVNSFWSLLSFMQRLESVSMK